MFVCPVCEHAQTGGSECENCGRPFPAPLTPPQEFPLLPDLEPTLQPAAGEGVADEVPGVERTAALPMPPARVEPLADLEASSGAPVDPPIEPLAELERFGDAGPADDRTPFPALVVCRYCRTEAAPGERICGHCGLRLPVPAAWEGPGAGEEPVRVCSCGTLVRHARCPVCGARA